MAAKKRVEFDFLSDDEETQRNFSPTNKLPPSASAIKKLNSPPAVAGVSKFLRTNKNGLPLDVQRAILTSIVNFRGLDNFAQNTCDTNPTIFGARGSPHRLACYNKRRAFLALYHSDLKEFVALCNQFGIEVEIEPLEPLVPSQLFGTPKSNARKEASAEVVQNNDTTAATTSNSCPVYNQKPVVEKQTTDPYKYKKMGHHLHNGKFVEVS